MTDMEIPQAVRETAANALKGTRTLFETCPELAQEVTDLVLKAALPHLLTEVKSMCETATALGLALGRKEACEEAIERLSELAQRIAPGNPHPALGRDTVVRYLQDIASRTPGAASNGLTASSRHPDTPEDTKPPQEPCVDADCPIPLMHTHTWLNAPDLPEESDQ